MREATLVGIAMPVVEVDVDMDIILPASLNIAGPDLSVYAIDFMLGISGIRPEVEAAYHQV